MFARPENALECGCRNLVRNICSRYATWGDLWSHKRQTQLGQWYITSHLGLKTPIIRTPSPDADPKVRDSGPNSSISHSDGVSVDACLRNVTDGLVNDILHSLACPLDRKWVFAHRRTPAFLEHVIPVDEQLQMRLEDLDGYATLRPSRIAGDERCSHR